MNNIVNKDVLELQQGCIYGPVKSRRLKSSLGLNVLPLDKKLCSFNCIYCQYGLTKKTMLTTDPDPEIKLPTVNEVEKALQTALQSLEREIYYITFSGNGESTLHPDFPELVDMVIRVRDKYYSSAKTAILSNSSMMFKDSVFNAVMKLDMPIMKLDAGDETMFKKINRPAEGIKFSEIIESLKRFDHPNLTLQTLFMGTKYLNTSPESIENWAAKIKEINPKEAHIYSLDRPAAFQGIISVSKKDLTEIAERAKKLNGIEVLAF